MVTCPSSVVVVGVVVVVVVVVVGVVVVVVVVVVPVVVFVILRVRLTYPGLASGHSETKTNQISPLFRLHLLDCAQSQLPTRSITPRT